MHQRQSNSGSHSVLRFRTAYSLRRTRACKKRLLFFTSPHLIPSMSRRAAKACTSKLKGSHDHGEPPPSDREALLLEAEATIIGEWGPKEQRRVSIAAACPHPQPSSGDSITHTVSQMNRRDDASGTEREGIHVYCRAWKQVRSSWLRMPYFRAPH